MGDSDSEMGGGGPEGPGECEEVEECWAGDGHADRRP